MARVRVRKRTLKSGGEFGEVVSGASIDIVMNVLDEHMAVVKVLLPKEYQAVIEKIKEAPE